MGWILGCGIDIEELSRFSRLIPNSGAVPGFSKMVFTDREIENHLRIRPEVTFPLSFSCKEAFFKAFGMSWSNSAISWKDIELFFNDENDLNNYSINFQGYALDLSNEGSFWFETSFEINEDHVVFQVVLFQSFLAPRKECKSDL
jgi:phosphopantetheine--protein transferase-like protein